MKVLPFTKCCIISLCDSLLPNLDLVCKITYSQAHTHVEKAWFILFTEARNTEVSNHVWIPLLVSPPASTNPSHRKKTKAKTQKKPLHCWHSPRNWEAEFCWVRRDGTWLIWLKLVGCKRRACLLCCWWQPCWWALCERLHSRGMGEALRKSLNKGGGKRKK